MLYQYFEDCFVWRHLIYGELILKKVSDQKNYLDKPTQKRNWFVSERFKVYTVAQMNRSANFFCFIV